MLFLLWLCLFILYGVISPLISSHISAPSDLGSSYLSVLYFCLFLLFMGFSRQEYRNGLPFPSPVEHVLSELSTMTCLSWVVLHGTAHCFTDLDQSVLHVIRWVSFCDCGFQSVCPLMEKDKKLWKLPDGRSWLRGKPSLILVGRDMLSNAPLFPYRQL